MTSTSSPRPPHSPDLWVVFILHCFPINPKLSRSDFHACLFTRVRDHLAEKLREDPSTVSCQERRAHLPDSVSDSAQRIQTRNFKISPASRFVRSGNPADPRRRTPRKSHQQCVRGGVKVRRKGVRDVGRSLPADRFHPCIHRSSVGDALRHRAAPAAAAAGLIRQAEARWQVGRIRACH